MSDPSSQPTQPAQSLTDEEWARIEEMAVRTPRMFDFGTRRLIATIQEARGALAVRRLEADRLQSELDEARRTAGAEHGRAAALEAAHREACTARDVRDTEIVRLRAENTALAEQLAAGEASDGYHTHNELYDYRMLYNAHAAHGWLAAGHTVVKSWKHSDGEPCFGGGWFVVAAELPTGQVTNHYEAKHWGLFNVPEGVPPEYDGHTPADAADRLRSALGLDQDGKGQANG